VVVGENDTVVVRVCGEMLEPADTTVLSNAVTDYAMAEDIFLDWIAPMKEQDVEKAEDGYIYNLTDDNGNPQGSVEFRKADGSEGILAKMTVGEGAALKAISEIRFIAKDAWPENAVHNKLYKKGELYGFVVPEFEYKTVKLNNGKKEDRLVISSHRNREFYCLQGNDNGKEALLVYLSPDVNEITAHFEPKDYAHSNVYKHFASLYHAQKVLDFYNSNHDEWEQMIEFMEARGHKWDWHYGTYTVGNAVFLLNSYNKEGKTMKCLDLDEKIGRVCDVVLHSFWSFEYRYMFVRTEYPYSGK
jgi:hypothetical protein